MGKIRRIELNLEHYSPCSICARELRDLLIKIQTGREPFIAGSGKAILSWDRYYPGFTYKESRNLTATTWQSINELGAAGWTIHAPASAMPRERTAATEKALRFVIHRPPGG